METNKNLATQPMIVTVQHKDTTDGKITRGILTCKQCRENLCDPVTLECLHSVCKECFQKLKIQFRDSPKNEKPFVECPSCEYVTPIQPTSTKGFDLNYSSALLKNIIILTLIDYQKEDNPNCLPCRNRNKTSHASFWCFVCIAYLCDECFLFHKSLPFLEKHKTYKKEEVLEDPFLFAMAREICDTHGLHLSFVCKANESACCDKCILSNHINQCKGNHVGTEQSSCFVDTKLPVLKMRIKLLIDETTSLLKDVCRVEVNTEKSFKDWLHLSSKTSENFKQTFLEKVDQLLAESYKVTNLKLTEIDSKITTLKQKKLILENARDVIIASRSGSDVRYFLEKKKVENIIKDVKKDTEIIVKENFKNPAITLDISLTKVLELDSFGSCRKVQTLKKEEENDRDNKVIDTLGSSNALSPPCSNNLNKSSSVHGEPDRRIVRSFKFGFKTFSFLKTIKLGGAVNCHITGCAWKSEYEIVVVDANLEKEQFRIYNTQNGTLSNTVRLNCKPFDLTVCSKQQCVITCPREKKILVYNLETLTKSNVIDVPFHCYGVCQLGEGIVVAGNDSVAFFDINFKIIRTVKLDEKNARYINAYDNNIIFYTDMVKNHVFSTMGDGKSRFTYSYKEIQCPAGFILDENTNMYLCEKSSSFLHILSKSGAFIEKIRVGQTPTAISLSKSKEQICIVRGGRHWMNKADIYVSN